MRIGAALSTYPDPAKATAAAVEEARSRLDGAEVSLALVVASRHHALSAQGASEVVRVKAGPERVIGCVAETVVGGHREVKGGPAIAVWLPSLPEPVETFHMQFVRTPEGGVFGGYRFEEAGSGPSLLIGDPFSFPTDLLLGHVNEQAGQRRWAVPSRSAPPQVPGPRSSDECPPAAPAKPLGARVVFAR